MKLTFSHLKMGWLGGGDFQVQTVSFREVFDVSKCPTFDCDIVRLAPLKTAQPPLSTALQKYQEVKVKSRCCGWFFLFMWFFLVPKGVKRGSWVKFTCLEGTYILDLPPTQDAFVNSRIFTFLVGILIR